MTSPRETAPTPGLPGLRRFIVSDARSGFLIFLLALPLSLAISQASGFPPVAGLLTAIVGGLAATWCGGAELTIKGPTAMLAVVAAGAVEELGHGNPLLGYRLVLAVVVLAGIIQIILGLLRTGGLSDFFPATAVHGMMAALGLSLVAQQLFVLLGVPAPAGGPLQLLAALPLAFARLNPGIFLIGALGLSLMLGWPLLTNTALRKIPASLLVLLLAIALGHWFGLGPNALVKLPGTLAGTLTFPDLSQVFAGPSLKYVAMFALAGSLETLLSAKAVDQLYPQQRRADLNRELLGVGIASTLAGLLGGPPMVSDLGRSVANGRNGARTRWAGLYQGLLLLLFVAFGAGLLPQIPLAALAAILIHAGGQLVAPRQLFRLLRTRGEPLLIFLVTFAVTLASNLLLGLAAGVLTKLVAHVFRGMPLRNVFTASVEVQADHAGNQRVTVRDAAVLSNFSSLKNRLDVLPAGHHVIIDLSQTQLVDQSVLENLNRFQADYATTGGQVELVGLEAHLATASSPTAAQLQQAPTLSPKHS